MKNTIKLLGLALCIHSGTTAQNNTSYRPNNGTINGFESTAFGLGTLQSNTGHSNTASGFGALLSNTSGNLNVGDGHYSLAYNTTGSENTSTGARSMLSNTTGSANTASGYYSLLRNTVGNNNTAIGSKALEYNVDGNGNTALGHLSLTNNVSGYINVGLGMYSNVSASNQFNSAAIGPYSLVNANYKVRLGAATVTSIEGQVAYSIPSDGRFKNNISETDVKGLDFIKQLRPVVYNFDTRKFQEFLTKNMPDSLREEYLKADFSPSTAIRQSGFIAQEVEAAAKQCGYNFNGVHKPNDDNDNYSIAYSQFVIPLVKGMQEQQKMIENQQQEIEELKKIVGELVSKQPNISSATRLDDVSIYPNPTQGAFTINTNNMEVGTIDIVDMKGVLIQHIKMQHGVSHYPIDLSAQAKGVYLINIQTDNGTISQKLIVE